jgi:hypothetical protein
MRKPPAVAEHRLRQRRIFAHRGDGQGPQLRLCRCRGPEGALRRTLAAAALASSALAAAAATTTHAASAALASTLASAALAASALAAAAANPAHRNVAGVKRPGRRIHGRQTAKYTALLHKSHRGLLVSLRLCSGHGGGLQLGKCVEY